MFITLTRIKREMTEEALKKLDAFEDDVNSRAIYPPKDEYGKTAKDYETLGMEIPKYLLDKTNNNDYLELHLEKDYELKITKVSLKVSEIEYMEDVSNDTTYLGNTVIYGFQGEVFNVEDKLEKILKLIK